MLTFKQFITEDLLIEGKDNMVGVLGGEGKGIGHVRNYVMPFLSKEGRAKTIKALGKHGRLGSADSHGEHYKASATHTHTLHTAVNGHKAGTKVKVTHVTVSGHQLIAHTKSHGQIPLSKLAKPKTLRKAAKVEGFNVEARIAANLGEKAAGSTKHGYDFKYKTAVRGESKLVRGKMGQSTFKHTKEKGWHFTNEDIGKHFAKATVKGPDGRTRGLIAHFNKYHPDGKIPKGYKIKAPEGTTRAYLKSGGKKVNVLHIHSKEGDHGTTYTFGRNNELRGKTKLSHLTEKHLDALDGFIQIEKTTTGSTSAIHRPKVAVMKEYAHQAKEHPKEHRDLTKPEHAEELKQHVDKIK